jgi:NAD(P)H dehydrogenase (quinone)
VRDESKAAALKEQGVDIRVGSYDDCASLVDAVSQNENRAMQGIEQLLLM